MNNATLRAVMEDFLNSGKKFRYFTRKEVMQMLTFSVDEVLQHLGKKEDLSSLLKKLDDQKQLIEYTGQQLRLSQQRVTRITERYEALKAEGENERQKNFRHLKRIEQLEKELKQCQKQLDSKTNSATKSISPTKAKGK